MSQNFALDYNDVNSRLAEFRDKHPEGSLQPADVACPFEVKQVGDKTFIAYTAAAYRNPEDPRPGIGCAWEPFPGRTNFTRDSELQNAETSAWGRAIVAALAADTKKGIASAEDVRNRQAERTAPAPESSDLVLRAAKARVWTAAKGRGIATADDLAIDYAATHDGQTLDSATVEELTAYAETLEQVAA
jgi:hypothetical protein